MTEEEILAGAQKVDGAAAAGDAKDDLSKALNGEPESVAGAEPVAALSAADVKPDPMMVGLMKGVSGKLVGVAAKRLKWAPMADGDLGDMAFCLAQISTFYIEQLAGPGSAVMTPEKKILFILGVYVVTNIAAGKQVEEGAKESAGESSVVPGRDGVGENHTALDRVIDNTP